MQQTNMKRVQDEAWLGKKGDLLGSVQEIKIWPYTQIVYVQTKIRLREWDLKFCRILISKQIL